MKKKLFIFIFSFIFLFTSKVNAEACDSADIKRLKELASGVEISYELQEKIINEYGAFYDLYKLNITGLTDEILVYNETDDVVYNVNTNFNDNILESGKKKLIIKAYRCSQTLKRITLKLPIYNFYSENQFCKKKENKDLDVCQKWVTELITNEDFYEEVNKVNKERTKDNNIVNFIINNIIILACLVLLIIGLIIFIIVKKKKEVLE